VCAGLTPLIRRAVPLPDYEPLMAPPIRGSFVFADWAAPEDGAVVIVDGGEWNI